MEEKVLDKLFSKYAAAVMAQIPVDSIQYTEMRRSFYSGMIAMFSYLVNMPEQDGTNEPTENDLNKMDSLQEEIAVWALTELITMKDSGVDMKPLIECFPK